MLGFLRLQKIQLALYGRSLHLMVEAKSLATWLSEEMLQMADGQRQTLPMSLILTSLYQA